ncbi:MAG: RRXRR domain-containing protein [Deltaproteobacteria bacterium]|nr:RRXRR domain-containing protein [Deltaproteobacteria bacterium]
MFARRLNVARKLSRFFPATSITARSSKFDKRKMENPEINGVEYRRGGPQGHEAKERLLDKRGHRRRHRGKEDAPPEADHILARSDGGRPAGSPT